MAAIQASAHSIRYPLACAETVTSAHFVQRARAYGIKTNDSRYRRNQFRRASLHFDWIVHRSNSAKVMKDTISVRIGEVGVILAADRMVLENEGNDIRVNDDGGHAAGSAFLWPRHSWRAARKSSMGSSSGQKFPCRACTSVIGPFPCCAISSSSVGLASKL